EYSQTSAAIIPKATTMKKSSGVTIPPPPSASSMHSNYFMNLHLSQRIIIFNSMNYLVFIII
ncbi:unnamed protein product, partial [Adineta steineri]